jgi:hypothetical protein
MCHDTLVCGPLIGTIRREHLNQILFLDRDRSRSEACRFPIITMMAAKRFDDFYREALLILRSYWRRVRPETHCDGSNYKRRRSGLLPLLVAEVRFVEITVT